MADNPKADDEGEQPAFSIEAAADLEGLWLSADFARVRRVALAYLCASTDASLALILADRDAALTYARLALVTVSIRGALDATQRVFRDAGERARAQVSARRDGQAVMAEAQQATTAAADEPKEIHDPQ